MKILVCGLPGSGKTTIAIKLATMLGAVHFNADDVRRHLPGLGFSHADRLLQSTRMNWLASTVALAGVPVICDFICPTEETRAKFFADYTIWMDTVERGRFADTDAMWQSPSDYDIRIGAFSKIDAALHQIYNEVMRCETRPTAQMMGRFQPWHAGHRALFVKSLQRVGFVCIMVRTMPLGPDNPYNFGQVKAAIEKDLEEYAGQFMVIAVPNISAIHYGRDVGYKIEQIELPPAVQAISASRIRKLANSG
jgi:hypothetical protein